MVVNIVKRIGEFIYSIFEVIGGLIMGLGIIMFGLFGLSLFAVVFAVITYLIYLMSI